MHPKNFIFPRPFLEVKSDLDCKKTLVKTSGVTRPCWNGIQSLCLMRSSWDIFDFVEKSHSYVFIYIKIGTMSLCKSQPNFYHKQILRGDNNLNKITFWFGLWHFGIRATFKNCKIRKFWEKWKPQRLFWSSKLQNPFIESSHQIGVLRWGQNSDIATVLGSTT